jgi:tetratricopeptide (TPR) repeat protein
MKNLWAFWVTVVLLAWSGSLAVHGEDPAKGQAPTTAATSKAASVPASNPSRYDQARALYREGSERAPEIIRLLREEIADNPTNRDAVALLGITLYGTEKFQEAVEQFEKVEAMANKSGDLLSGVVFLRVKALLQLQRYEDAADVLNAYWAIFDNDPNIKQEYEELSPLVDRYVLSLRAASSVRIIVGLTETDLEGWMAIPVELLEWEKLSKDRNVGPFLELKKPGRKTMAVIVLPENNAKRRCGCVFWEGRKPVGSAVLDVDSPKDIPLADLQKKYVKLNDNGEVATDKPPTTEPAVSTGSVSMRMKPIFTKLDDGDSVKAWVSESPASSKPSSAPAK